MVQAFTRGATPTKIGSLTVQLNSFPADPTPAAPNANGATQKTPFGSFYLQLLDANGAEVKMSSGDVVPFLSATDQQWLTDFMQRMRTKAVTEAL